MIEFDRLTSTRSFLCLKMSKIPLRLLSSTYPLNLASFRRPRPRTLRCLVERLELSKILYFLVMLGRACFGTPRGTWESETFCKRIGAPPLPEVIIVLLLPNNSARWNGKRVRARKEMQTSKENKVNKMHLAWLGTDLVKFKVAEAPNNSKFSEEIFVN